MPRTRLSTNAIVDAALDLVDEQGMPALTMAAIAGRVGVATPSLYKHVNGIAGLRTLVSLRVMTDMADRFATAVMGRSGDDAVATLMRSFRDYVTAHPGRYAAMPADPLRDPALAAAGSKLLNVFLAVLHDYGLPDSAAIHATRSARAIVHGFTSIEASGGFGLAEDRADTYEQLIQMFVASLPRR